MQAINRVHKNVIKGDFKGIYVVYKISNMITKNIIKIINLKYTKKIFYSLAIKKF